MLNQISFVLYKDKKGISHYVGTAFFVGEYLKDINQSFVYIVTAKHVVAGISTSENDGFLYLRINTKNGEVINVPSRLEDWAFHEDDPYADVAVFFGAPSNHNESYRAVPLEYLVTDKIIKEEKIDIGDETFMAGLFINHFGKKKNSPILRTGNIAMMPEEPVQANLGGEKVPMEAYLVECRSIGGLSGSPVFVRLNPWKKQFLSAMPSTGYDYLLGVAQGHWDQSIYKEEDPVIKDINDVLTAESVNKGVAIVTPSKKILDIIQQGKIKNQRINAENKYREKMEK